VDEAWRVMALETLADAGLVEPKPIERARVPSGPQADQFPVFEAKLVTTIRLDPADDDRINAPSGKGKGRNSHIKKRRSQPEFNYSSGITPWNG